MSLKRAASPSDKTLGVWKFIDPAGAEELQDPRYPEPKDIRPAAERYSDLSEDEETTSQTQLSRSLQTATLFWLLGRKR